MVATNSETVEITYAELPLSIEVEYHAPRGAPPCSNPSDPAYSIPPEPASCEIFKIMLDSHDIADVISDLAFDAIEKKVLDQLVIANGDDV